MFRFDIAQCIAIYSTDLKEYFVKLAFMVVECTCKESKHRQLKTERNKNHKKLLLVRQKLPTLPFIAIKFRLLTKKMFTSESSLVQIIVRIMVQTMQPARIHFNTSQFLFKL